MRKLGITTMIAALTAAVAAGTTPGAVQAQTPPPAHACFQSMDWKGWKAPNANVMYIDTGFQRIFRLEFAQDCPELLWPNARLITHIRGSSLICSPIDIDLKVSDGGGFAVPCIVSKMTLLSPAETAAIPKKDRP